MPLAIIDKKNTISVMKTLNNLHPGHAMFAPEFLRKG